MRLWDHIISYNVVKKKTGTSAEKQIATYAGIYSTLGSLEP